MSRLSPLTPFEISRLPKPDVIETLSFEAVLAAMKADFLARWAARREADPDLAAIDAETLEIEGEPLVVLLEAAAFRETLLRGRVNDAARALLLVYSEGLDLDHLAAGLDVRREVAAPATEDAPAVMESDARLQRRVLLAASAFNTAGAAKAYVFYALTAAPSLADASAVKAEPGQVVVTLLGGETPEPSPREFASVRAALAREDLLPTTAYVAVRGPTVKEVAVEAELILFPGPAKELILAEAGARLAAYRDANRRLGADLARSAILARLHVEGVHSVKLIAPAEDVLADFGEVVIMSSIALVAPERAS